MRQLYRLSCSVDSVVSAASPEEALAFARAQRHELHVEAMPHPEALIGLDPGEAVIVLAALRGVLELDGLTGIDVPAVEALVERLEEAVVLLDEQSTLHLEPVAGR